MILMIFRGLGWTLLRAVLVALPVLGALAIAAWVLSTQYGSAAWWWMASAAGAVLGMCLVLGARGSFWMGPPPCPPPRTRVDHFVNRVVTGSLIGLVISLPLTAVVAVIAAVLALFYGWGVFASAAIVAGLLAEGAVVRSVVRTVRKSEPEGAGISAAV
jgi:cytochrome b561